MDDTLNDSMSAAMTELGIDPSSLDEGPELATETKNKEVEGEVKEEVVETEESGEGQEEQSTEGEENEEAAETEKVEESKLTAKEIQEIEAAKQALEAEKQAFTEQKAQLEKEFQEKYLEKVKTHDEIDAFFNHLASKDPELFDLLKGEFQEHQKQYSNPVLDQIRQETAALKEELSAFKSKASDEVTRTKLDAELNQVKSTIGKDAESKGIKIDWDKVQDVWADNPKLNLESAVYAVYGANLMKASASKAKVEAVEKKIAARPVVSTSGAVNRSNAPMSKDYSGMSVRDVVGDIARQIAGKS